MGIKLYQLGFEFLKLGSVDLLRKLEISWWRFAQFKYQHICVYNF